MIGWQPIETAPQMRTILLFAVTERLADGLSVLNWKIATGFICRGEDGELGCEWEGRELKSYDHKPTHWMPLPDPPTEALS